MDVVGGGYEDWEKESCVGVLRGLLFRRSREHIVGYLLGKNQVLGLQACWNEPQSEAGATHRPDLPAQMMHRSDAESLYGQDEVCLVLEDAL